MFTILLGFFNHSEKILIKKICLKNGPIRILEATTSMEWVTYTNQYEINTFFISSECDTITLNFLVSSLRDEKTYAFTPILIFSTKIETLVSACIQWKSCNFFLFPLNEKQKSYLSSLIHYYDCMYQKIHQAEQKSFLIQGTKYNYNLLYEDILCAESFMKKTVIHTKNESIPFCYPLYKVRTLLPENTFIQTHRSFIINMNNVSYIDKTTDPWSVYFFNSSQEAFISRRNKKHLPSSILV